MEYCPDCCDQLKPQSKNLGGLTVWLVCPGCGYRKRPKYWIEEHREADVFYKRKDMINNLWQKEDE
jgi:DNA-directed RNA polymerase subunit M/transcription elongation factor TFIIS